MTSLGDDKQEWLSKISRTCSANTVATLTWCWIPFLCHLVFSWECKLSWEQWPQVCLHSQEVSILAHVQWLSVLALISCEPCLVHTKASIWWVHLYLTKKEHRKGQNILTWYYMTRGRLFQTANGTDSVHASQKVLPNGGCDGYGTQDFRTQRQSICITSLIHILCKWSRLVWLVNSMRADPEKLTSSTRLHTLLSWFTQAWDFAGILEDAFFAIVKKSIGSSKSLS